ncbi:MAG: hypothetical protein JW751_07230 [Polyangiaceae bacterium]|nr:hypothetical protein [Polyangiaceae bacterium]
MRRPALLGELRVHAWRMARLEGIKQLATDEDDTDLVARCDALIAREEARHVRRMEGLRTGPGAGSAAPGTSAAEAEPGSPKAPTATPEPAAS